MQRIVGRMRTGLVALGMLLAAASLWAYPRKGAAAPPLVPLTLLQAAPGARADWASLKGKVVVVEFWATWCSPCVASLPHLNQLVESLDPAKFQFISVDDEEQAAVENFLAKKKMSGWVGLDPSGAIFNRYGVESRPTTVIIDGEGRIAAVTEIESVTTADLQALASGRTVTFKPAMEIVEAPSSPIPATERLLFSVSVTKAATEATMSRVNHPPTGTDLLGEDADGLIADVFNVFGNRYVLNTVLPEGRYNLRVSADDASRAMSDAAIRQAVLASLHLEVQSKTFTRPAYLLRATAAGRKLLSPSASTHAVKRGCWHGKFLLMNGTMDDLAFVLATALETPVVNETGIGGTYDARFQVAGRDVDSLNSTLREALGLELVPGGRESSLTVYEVNAQEGSEPSPPIRTEASKR